MVQKGEIKAVKPMIQPSVELGVDEDTAKPVRHKRLTQRSTYPLYLPPNSTLPCDHGKWV